MKIRIILAAVLTFAILPLESYGQMDERKPGIYAVVGEESIPLPYSYHNPGRVSVGVLGVSIGNTVYKFDDVSSGVNATGTFVLVIDPKKKKGIISRKKFDLFYHSMTPENMMFLPLIVNNKHQRREYDEGTRLGIGIGGGHAEINTKNPDRYEFEWEQISDNSFKITVSGLTPGEYGIAFRPSKLSQFYVNAIHGFTIPEPQNSTIE